MNIQQRQAWFVLKVAILALIAYSVGVAIIGFRIEATAALGLFGIAGLTPFIGRKERPKGTVTMDERDQEIAKVASMAGFSVVWLYFCAVCMAPFFLRGPNSVLSVPTNLPPLILMLGMMIVFTVRSLVVVIMYQRGMPRGEA